MRRRQPRARPLPRRNRPVVLAPAAAVGGAPGDAMLAQLASGMIRDFEVMERDQQGYSTTNGLFTIINTLRPLPGRKSLVLFSEGIAIPPAVQRLFLGVIDAANRANVSIYAMDAAGLRAESEQAKIRDQVNEAGGSGGGLLSVRGSDAPLSKSLENNEDVLRQDPHNGLGTLAQDTGGLLFENTNNLQQGFDRDRERSAQLLSRRLHPGQPEVRRPLPKHRGEGDPPRCDGGGTEGLLRGPRCRRRAGQCRGKRLRLAPSKRSRCRTGFPSEPARCCSPNAIAPASFLSSSISKPRRSRSSRARIRKPIRLILPSSSGSSTRRIMSFAR